MRFFEYATVSKSGLRIQLFFSAQRMIPLDLAFTSCEQSDFELSDIPTNGNSTMVVSSVSPERADTMAG